MQYTKYAWSRRALWPAVTVPHPSMTYTLAASQIISRAILSRRKGDLWRKTPPTDTPILAQPARSQATK